MEPILPHQVRKALLVEHTFLLASVFAPAVSDFLTNELVAVSIHEGRVAHVPLPSVQFL